MDRRAPREGTPGRAPAARDDHGRHRRARRPGARRRRRTGAATSTSERRQALARVAEVMAANRGRTIAVMAHETGKTVREGDPEVSEAVDFARWAGVQHPRPRRARRRRRGRRPARRRARRRAVELPDRDPVQRRRRRPRRRQRGAAQAGSRGRRHGRRAGAPRPRGRASRPTWSSSCAAPTTTSAATSSPTPTSTASRSTGSYETARMFLDWKPSTAAPRRDERQERDGDQPDGRSSISPFATSCARRSVTPGRSARRPAWRSSRRRCTTTPRSGAGSPTPCAASGSGRQPTSPRWSARSSSRAAGKLARGLTQLDARRVVARRARAARR